MRRFRTRTHGEVRLNVKQSTTPTLLEDVKSGVVDVAFCGTMGDDPEIVFDPIWAQQAVLIVNRLHPLAGREEFSLAELQNQYLISYNLTGPLASELTDLVKGYDLLIDYLYSDEITLASLVAGNPDLMAIACRSWLLDSYAREVKLARLTEAPDKFHQLYLCSLKHVHQSHATSLFIDTVKRYCVERNADERLS